MLKEGVSDHCHERVSMKAVPGSALEVVEPEFFFPRQRSIPDNLSIPAEDILADAKWQNITWRTGTKVKLSVFRRGPGAHCRRTSATDQG